MANGAAVAIVIIIILILIGVGVGLYFYFRNKKYTNITPAPTLEPIPLVSTPEATDLQDSGPPTYFNIYLDPT